MRLPTCYGLPTCLLVMMIASDPFADAADSLYPICHLVAIFVFVLYLYLHFMIADLATALDLLIFCAFGNVSPQSVKSRNELLYYFFSHFFNIRVSYIWIIITYQNTLLFRLLVRF